MNTIIHKPHQAPAAPEPEGFAEWWAQWPSRTIAAGRRAHYAEAFAGGQALERERCARIAGDNYGWRGDNKEYEDNLGEAIRRGLPNTSSGV